MPAISMLNSATARHGHPIGQAISFDELYDAITNYFENLSHTVETRLFSSELPQISRKSCRIRARKTVIGVGENPSKTSSIQEFSKPKTFISSSLPINTYRKFFFGFPV